MPRMRAGCWRSRGLGTMVARLMDSGAIGPASTSCWMRIGSCSIVRRRLRDSAATRACAATYCRMGCRWVICGCAWCMPSWQLPGGRYAARADVLIADAVLDLVDIQAVLPGLLRCSSPAASTGSRSTTTARASRAGHPHDDQVMQAYHRDVDERFATAGRPGKANGRRLFTTCGCGPRAGGGVVDWVVYPARTGTTWPTSCSCAASSTIRNALRKRQDRVEPADLANWLAERGQQLAAASWSIWPSA